MVDSFGFRRWALAFALLWVFLVLYPRPTALGESVFRLFQFPGNPPAVESSAFPLPEALDPPSVEQHILLSVPYQYDWQVYNLPWYFPSAEEALQQRGGDCKTRLVILAAVFEQLAIPYEVYISPTHIWINYEGKEDTRIENIEAAMFISDGDEIHMKMPTVDWRDGFNAFWEAFWVYMPLDRKVYLLSGLGFSFLLSLTPGRTRRFPSH